MIAARTETTFSYFVVMQDYGRRGREAIVDPEMTRRDVVACIKSGEYRDISFIHEITMNETPRDVTAELIAEAGLPEIEPHIESRQAAMWDYARGLRKHEVM